MNTPPPIPPRSPAVTCKHGIPLKDECADCSTKFQTREETPVTQPMRARRFRESAATVPSLVPELVVDERVQAMAEQLRREWAANIDRKAIDAAAQVGQKAHEHSAAAVKTSHRRWMTIIVLLGILFVAIGMLFAFAKENRARLEHLERLTEARP